MPSEKNLPGKEYYGYSIDYYVPKHVLKQPPFLDARPSRHITDLMRTPPDGIKCGAIDYQRMYGTWWKNSEFMNQKDALQSFALNGETGYATLGRKPSGFDLIISEFVKFWVKGLDWWKGSGQNGSVKFSKLMREYRNNPEKYSPSNRNASNEEIVVAKALELFHFYKKELTSPTDFVLYRGMPYKFVNAKDESFISAAPDLKDAVDYVSADFGAPVKHKQSQACVAVILVPKGIPVIKVEYVVKGSLGVRHDIEHILPPGYLCQCGDMYIESRTVMKKQHDIRMVPVIYIPATRFQTDLYKQSLIFNDKTISPISPGLKMVKVVKDKVAQKPVKKVVKTASAQKPFKKVVKTASIVKDKDAQKPLKKVVKKVSPQKPQEKQCESGKVLNPLTGRCIKKDGSLAKKLGLV